MSKEEQIRLSVSQLKEKLGIDADVSLIDAVAKHLGVALLSDDASLVACGDDSERETIKEKFLKGKLGLTENDNLDEAIEKICEDMGKSNPQKRRVAFYYLLAKHYGKTL